MLLIKKIISCIVTPLTFIFNQSLMAGKFPKGMKIAKVIPIYKSGDKHLFSNYRPISLLSQFSKIVEKVFAKRLNDFISKHNILCEQQYGFRTNRTTSHALIDFIEQITNATERHEYTVGIFLDLQKAFDTIDHKILLSKLQKYGIRGLAHEWLTSYLEDRYQFVHINDQNSTLLEITCGVPQGSVLGPLLFILYINDFCLISRSLKCILFADDTTIFCCGRNLKQLLDTVENELQTLKKWFDVNKLSLHLGKTKCMIFRNRVIDYNQNIKINDVEIETVCENKFLGIIIDNKLNWKSHINHVVAKISRSISILHKAQDMLNQKSLYMLYYSLIVPYMTYCVEVWL